MSIYVFAPAGPDRLQNNILEKCIEYIGSKQSGYGSNSAKGRRFLKRKLGCSGRTIKRTVSKKYKIIRNIEFETFGPDVYYYHSVFCAQIVGEIIDYINRNADSSFKKNIFKSITTGEDYLNESYAYRLSQLKWVRIENYQNQSTKAKNIEGQFDILRNELKQIKV